MKEGEQMRIQPNAWVKTFLETQLDGLTGHLEQAGFPFDRVRWGAKPDYQKDNGGNPGWWVYEETAYWVDGLIRCALLLRIALKISASLLHLIKRAGSAPCR